jgi:hypothetical protein
MRGKVKVSDGVVQTIVFAAKNKDVIKAKYPDLEVLQYV